MCPSHTPSCELSWDNTSSLAAFRASSLLAAFHASSWLATFWASSWSATFCVNAPPMRLQRAFKRSPNAASTRPQKAQTCSQCTLALNALNATPTCPRGALNTSPQGMFIQPVLRQKLTSIIFLPCPSHWNALLLSARRLGMRHDAPCPLAPHHWMSPTPPWCPPLPRPACRLGTTSSLAAFCMSNDTLDAPPCGEDEGHVKAHFARAHHTPYPARHLATMSSLAAFRVLSLLTTFRASTLDAHSTRLHCRTPMTLLLHIDALRVLAFGVRVRP